MWPFRRNRGTGEADAPEPATGPVHRAGPAAWRSAPPLAVVQTSRTTIDSEFVSHLATRADPSFLAPLGHHVVPEAPAGSVHGLAVPAAGPRTFAPPPGAFATTQRVVADTGSATATPVATPAATPEATPEATPDAHAVAAATTPAPVARPLVTPQRMLVDASTVAIPPVPARAAVQLRRLDHETVPPEAGPLPVDADPPAAIADDPPASGAAPSTSSTSGAAPSTSPTIGADAATPTPVPARNPMASPTPNPTASPTPAAPPVVSRATDPAATTGRPRPRIGAPIERPAPGAEAAVAAPSAVQRKVELPPTEPSPSQRSADEAPGPGAADLVGTTPLAPVAPTAGPASERPGSAAVAAAGPSVQTATNASNPAIRATPAATSTPLPTTAVTSTIPSGAPSPRAASPSPSPRLGTGATRPVAPIGPPVQRRVDEPIVTPTLGGEPIVTPTLGGETLGGETLGASPVEPSPSSRPHGPVPSVSPPAASVTTTAVASRALAGPTEPPPTVLRELVGSSTSPAATTAAISARPRPPAVHSPLGIDAEPRFVHLAPLLGARPVATARHDVRPTDGIAEAAPAAATHVPSASRTAAATPSATAPGAPSTIASRSLTPSPPAVVSRSASMPPEVSRLVAAASAAPLTTGPAPEPTPAPDPPTETYVPPWVQRAEEPTTAGSPLGASEATGDAMPTAAVTVDTGEPSRREPSAAEIDQLAQALYPQLRRRLGRDLLLDRERLGYRTDIRF